jgi:hypothetical protein
MAWFGKNKSGTEQRRHERVVPGDENNPLTMSILTGVDDLVPVEWIDISAA